MPIIRVGNGSTNGNDSTPINLPIGITDVTGLNSAIDSINGSIDTLGGNVVTINNELASKLESPIGITDVTGLQTALGNAGTGGGGGTGDLDGGSPTENYTSSQSIDGGTP